MAYPVFEVHLEAEDGNNGWVTLYRKDKHQLLYLIDAHEIGPFDTALETSQWVWKALTRSLVANW